MKSVLLVLVLHLAATYSKFVFNNDHKSPHKSSRNGANVDLLVIHCTDGNLKSALNTFEDTHTEAPVSAHYVIPRESEDLDPYGDGTWMIYKVEII